MRNKIDKGLTMNLRFRFDQDQMVVKERNLFREWSYDELKGKITRSSPSKLRMYKKLLKKRKMNLH